VKDLANISYKKGLSEKQGVERGLTKKGSQYAEVGMLSGVPALPEIV